jgi:hypothetical protein
MDAAAHIEVLRESLQWMLGARTPAQLNALEHDIRRAHLPDADRAAALRAVNALRVTAPTARVPA